MAPSHVDHLRAEVHDLGVTSPLVLRYVLLVTGFGRSLCFEPLCLAPLWLAPLAVAMQLGGCGAPPRTAGHSVKPPPPDAAAPTARPSSSASTKDTQAANATNTRPLVPPETASRDSVAPATGAFGLPRSVALEMASPDGRWVAYCQPDRDTNGDGIIEVTSGPRGEIRGDEPGLFLARGESTEPFDELLTADPTGRFVVVVKDERPWLVDTQRGRRHDLSPFQPDLRGDGYFRLFHRGMSFDPEGQRLLVLHQKGTHDYEARLIDLTPLDEAQGESPTLAGSVPLPPGEAWRVHFSHDGKQALAQVILDGEGQRNFRWPAAHDEERLRRCGSAVQPASSWLHRGGTLTTHLLEFRPPSAEPAPGFVMEFGDGWVRREQSGRLVLVERGRQRQVASSRCGARILHADPSRGLFLISCEHHHLGKPPRESARRKRRRGPPKSRYDLYLVAPGFVHDLEADMSLTGLDVPPAETPRLVALRAGSRSVLVDFEARRLRELDTDARVVATHEEYALGFRGKELFLYDAEKNRSRTLTKSVAAFPQVVRGPGHFAYVEPWWVDLSTGQIVRHLGPPPLHLTNQGSMLVTDSAPTLEHWADGPLRWVAATPTPSP